MTIEFPDDPRGRELILMIERAKYERWLANEVARLIEEAFNEVVDTILSPSFRTLTITEQARKFQLFRELDRQIRQGYTGVTNTVLTEMQGYAQLEVEVARAQIMSMLSGASERIQSTVGVLLSRHRASSVAQLPVEGLNISDWFDAQAAGMSRETRRVLQNGLLQSRSIPEMVKGIVPPRGSVEPAVYRRARSDAMAVTSTTVNAVQTHAALESYQAAGEDVCDSFRLVAVRDTRTSAICRALDGLVQKINNAKAKRPPFHMRCRTTPVPIVKAEFVTRSDQMKPLTFGTYSDWLRGQSTSAQNQILGPVRADWWRSGKLTLADAVDQDNRVLTLAQLRQRLRVEDFAGV